jgi:C4-dicarboxylate-specific signal transduction histidine kinase
MIEQLRKHAIFVSKILSLRQMYILIFLSLLGWSFFAFHTMSQLIHEQKIYATLINLSGKQRMLSQKTTLMAKRVYETNNKKLVIHYKELFDLMKKDHKFIINNLTSLTMKKIYFNKPYELSKKVEKYFDLLEKFYKTRDNKILKQIEEYSFDLLPKLNHAVYEFEKESNQKTEYLESRELFILIGTIFTLLLESILIVIPILHKEVEYKQELEKLNNSLEKKVQEQTQQLINTNSELQELNTCLEQKVKEKTKENFQQFQVLQQQSKLAAMGEMVGAIAHQWRQPLNTLAIRIQRLSRDYKKDKVDAKFLEEFAQKNKETISFMSKTIDDFRNFFRIDKQRVEFDIKESIEQALSLFGAQLKNNNISVNLLAEHLVIDGFKTEFQQVIVNLISNSKDAFIMRDIKDAVININIKNNMVQVQDNAGGINDDIIDRIFEPYFTTKEQGSGTGMGLYISKMIIEDNFGGKLSAQNSQDGVIFTIEFKDNIIKS